MNSRDILVDPDVKTRLGRLVVLLDHWPDYYETAARDSGPNGDGGVFLLPGMSRHPSVVELGRALSELRSFAPNKSAHVFAYYSAPWRNVDQKRRVRVKGKFMVVDERVRQRVLPAWVRNEKVRDGVRLIAQDAGGEARPWCFRGDVFIPAPLLETYPGEPRVAA